MDNYPIENQVCTLEQTKELAELLGDNAPKSFWSWGIIPKNPYGSSDPAVLIQTKFAFDGEKLLAAYTGDELGALLPKKLRDNELMIFWEEKSCNACYGAYKDDQEEPGLYIAYCEVSKYEAQAKADLSIQLFKEEIITPEDFKYEH